MPHIKLLKVHPKAIVPTKGTVGAACFDLYGLQDCEIEPGGSITMGTGFEMEIPTDHALLIYSRSGQGFNNNVTLVNGTGIIDSDYRGHVMVGLRNDGPDYYFQPYGKAIAQAMLVYVPVTGLDIVDTLTETDRGDKGFGSTDRDPDMDGMATPKGPAPIMHSRHLK